MRTYGIGSVIGIGRYLLVYIGLLGKVHISASLVTCRYMYDINFKQISIPSICYPSLPLPPSFPPSLSPPFLPPSPSLPFFFFEHLLLMHVRVYNTTAGGLGSQTCQSC